MNSFWDFWLRVTRDPLLSTYFSFSGLLNLTSVDCDTQAGDQSVKKSAENDVSCENLLLRLYGQSGLTHWQCETSPDVKPVLSGVTQWQCEISPAFRGLIDPPTHSVLTVTPSVALIGTWRPRREDRETWRQTTTDLVKGNPQGPPCLPRRGSQRPHPGVVQTVPDQTGRVRCQGEDPPRHGD